MSEWAVRFLGVGGALAVELGSASIVIERDGQPWLMVDCGQEALTAYFEHYASVPKALFITHVHLDHVGGMERLFIKTYFDEALRGQVRLYVPVSVLPYLQRRIADYPSVLAEGGANYWDAFRVIPVSDSFWHDGVQLECFANRHHAPNSSFGLSLPEVFTFSGDTRPIPEQLEWRAERGDQVFHDCGVVGNPSHTGVDDLAREYSSAFLERVVLYHHGSEHDAKTLRQKGYRVANQGELFQFTP